MNAFGMDLAQWLWLLSSIITVESNGKVDAVGDGGKAIGILQIHACVIVDVNRVHGTSYSLDDRKNPDKSLDISIPLSFTLGQILSAQDRQSTNNRNTFKDLEWWTKWVEKRSHS